MTCITVRSPIQRQLCFRQRWRWRKPWEVPGANCSPQRSRDTSGLALNVFECRHGSLSDFPTALPFANKKVFTIPPMMRKSTFLARCRARRSSSKPWGRQRLRRPDAAGRREQTSCTDLLDACGRKAEERTPQSRTLAPMQRRRVGLQQLGGQVRAWLGEQTDIPRLGRCSLRVPQYDLVLAPCFGADGGAASERHCFMKAFFVLPSDRYMALWARQSCLHSLLLLLAASATPPKTAILRPAITQKRTIDDSRSFMAEPLLSGLPPFSIFARMCWTAIPFRLLSVTGVLHAQPTSGMQIHALSIKKNDS